MTPIAGFILAIIAGMVVKNGRRATAVTLVPWLIVLGYQSWYIASGRAVSPPGTVTAFPSATGYWLVQAIILAPALGIAALLGASRSRLHPLSGDGLARRAWKASALGVAVSVIIILLGFVWFRQQGGTAFVGHHSTDGSPPVIGMVGLLASFVTCGALAVMALLRRRSLKSGQPVCPGPEAATTAAARYTGE
jgi:hypothetical protein